ncbi:MAG: DUF4350 domain-containing protein [Verrucomicrobiota bacterium]
MNHQPAKLILLVGVALLFALGLADLFQLRFGRGDIYPEYSSLRTDPLGAKAFYESLSRLPGLGVQRNYRPIHRARQDGASAWFYLGADYQTLQQEGRDLRTELETITAQGGRLVIACSAVNEATTTNQVAKPTITRGKRGWLMATNQHGLEQGWQFTFAHQQLAATNEVMQPGNAIRKADLALPAALPWHSSLYFDQPGTNWNVLYARDGKAVIMERPLGKGSVVLVSDAYLFSNESLRKEQNAALLVWLVGTPAHIVFDETHLGVSEEPGIGTLIRQYHLHGVLAALIVFALLFVWTNATSLVPPIDETAQGTVMGRDATAGFLNLLRRNIQPREILFVCLQEWRRSVARGRNEYADRSARMEAAIRADDEAGLRRRNPAETYRELCRLADGKK